MTYRARNAARRARRALVWLEHRRRADAILNDLYAAYAALLVMNDPVYRWLEEMLAGAKRP